jgi:hypothetical protein
VFYANGAPVLEVVDANGDRLTEPAKIVNYVKRGSAPTRREYHEIEIDCAYSGPFTHLVALFHTSPVSGDVDYNWGEVVRVFPPHTPNFDLLYGTRNDTESRHTELKRRVRYLPADVPGQDLRLLGAMITSNAVSWQVHLQAHGLPNVLDDTA